LTAFSKGIITDLYVYSVLLIVANNWCI